MPVIQITESNRFLPTILKSIYCFLFGIIKKQINSTVASAITVVIAAPVLFNKGIKNKFNKKLATALIVVAISKIFSFFKGIHKQPLTSPLKIANISANARMRKEWTDSKYSSPPKM